MAKIFNSLDGEDWKRHQARVGFPILVEYARLRRAITYSEWDQEIVQRGLGKHLFLVNYGYPAGVIGDACQQYADYSKSSVPPINLMVVNQRGIPGKGADSYIKQFARQFKLRDLDPSQLTKRAKRAIIEDAHEKIFDFLHWADVLEAFGLKPTEVPTPSILRRPPNPGGWHTGPESEAHKNLKRCIANAPQMVDLPRHQSGKEEHLLWSGDKVDVYFVKSAVGVEVKAENASLDELHRGIFQCVKYKAVLRAQQIYEQLIPTADCVMAVGGTLPKPLQETASMLQVRFFQNLAAGHPKS